MISTGVDLVYIKRFEFLKEKDSFMKNNFTKSEINYIAKHNSLSTIAGIYASKEAFLKAIGKGINDYSLRDIEIDHNSDNKPFILLHNNLKIEYNSINISLSISHDGDYAIAMVTVFN